MVPQPILALPVFLKGIHTQAVDWSVESGKLLQHLIAYHGLYDPMNLDCMYTKSKEDYERRQVCNVFHM